MVRLGVDGLSERMQTGTVGEAIESRIIAFHRDEHGVWVADLECGHTQHVRHNPPWQFRPWITTTEGRSSHIGQSLRCKKCEEQARESAKEGI